MNLRLRKGAIWGAGLIAPIVAWVFVASWIWCAAMNIPFAFPFTQWIDATAWWRANWWCTLMLIVSAAAPTFVLGLAALALLPLLRRQRGGAPIYGKTGWATEPQMKAGGLRLQEKL